MAAAPASGKVPVPSPSFLSSHLPWQLPPSSSHEVYYVKRAGPASVAGLPTSTSDPQGPSTGCMEAAWRALTGNFHGLSEPCSFSFYLYGYSPNSTLFPENITSFIKHNTLGIAFQTEQLQHALSTAYGYHCVFLYITFEQLFKLYASDILQNDQIVFVL